jgi:hypothetical protein
MEEFQFPESPIIFEEKDYEKISNEFFESNSCKLFDSQNYNDSECGDDDSTGIPKVAGENNNDLVNISNMQKELTYSSPSINSSSDNNDDLYHSKQETDNDSNNKKKFVVMNRKRKRKDYSLKLFKGKLGKYIIKELSSVSPKIKFVLPDYKAFTQNINYEENKKWLTWTIKNILCIYDKKNKKNTNLINTISNNNSKLRNDEIKLLNSKLNKTYEQFAREFTESTEFQSNDMEEYRNDIKDNKGFIESMKDSKGNKKKH